VTVPHKQAVMAACTSLTAPAARIGAVNCLQFVAAAATGTTAVIGHNTDGVGFAAAAGGGRAGSARGRRRPRCRRRRPGGGRRPARPRQPGHGGGAPTRGRRLAPGAGGGARLDPGVLAEVVATAAVLIDATSAGLGRGGPTVSWPPPCR
jgi:hypothetical protein